MTRLSLLTLFLAFSASIALSQQVDSSSADDYVRERMRDLHIPGLSLAVVKAGKIVKASGYGMANLETDTPATPETSYKTASLSKSFIAAGILLLMQQGKIGPG